MKYPKMEEQEVPESTLDINFFQETSKFIVEKEKGIMGNMNEDENMGGLTWDFMEWENNYSFNELIEDDQIKVDQESSMFFQEVEEGHFSNIKEESGHGFWDNINVDIDEENENKCKTLKLSLNYEQVLDAWSDRGSLWAAGFSVSSTNNAYVSSLHLYI